MTEEIGNRLVLGARGQNLLRILIASYFLAGALGFIPGSDLTPLTRWLLPETLSGPVAATLVFVLAYLVMIGVWLRGAALVLAILTFWASYLRMIELGLASELGGFWRDLALIASLILTYAEPDAEALKRRAVISKGRRRRIRPRRIDREAAAAPAVPHHSYEPFHATYGHDKLSIEEMEALFHEEFKLARSSN